VARRRILSLARDHGSIQALAPVLRALVEQARIDLVPLAFDRGVDIYRQCGVAPISIRYDDFLLDRELFATRIIDEYTPDLAVLGASAPLSPPPETPEQYLLKSCKVAGTQTLTVLDAWGYYDSRFAIARDVPSTQWLIPDQLCVLDRMCVKDMVAMGCPPDRLQITHNPWLDRLETSDLPPRARGGDEFSVLFVSQPLLENQRVRAWPYTQHDLFAILVSALRQIQRRRPVKLAVWAHPLEDALQWNKNIREASDLGATIGKTRGREAFLAVDALVTSHSTAVYEALHYDVPCVVLRPGNPALAEHLSDKLQLTLRATDCTELEHILSRLEHGHRLLMHERRLKLLSEGVFFTDCRATGRVVDLIYSMLQSGGDRI
jgi:hypothetical protein